MIKRYARDVMLDIWRDENKFAKMLKIEVLVCEALSNIGKIPPAALRKIKKKARFNIARIRKIELKTRHDVVAFINNMEENLGREAKFLHLGLTSSDLLDTTLALQLVEASRILVDDLKCLGNVLKKKAKKYKNTVCIGRSHGVHAEPTTLGLKLALMYEETQRNIQRIVQAKEMIAVGKISGAVGNYAHIPPKVETYVCKKLDLKPVNISTQIIQRDRHAQFLTTISIIGSSLEKFATEIRHLQRTEVMEAEEPFTKGQKGSSAMPHKRNPIICERISGLARVLRANSQAALENIPLWHERDISHSSVERIICPDSTVLLDYMLNKFIAVIKDLIVYPENMITNLVKTKGLIFSQRLLLQLMAKGLGRSEAYKLVQSLAMKCWQTNLSFQDIVLDDKRILRVLKRHEVNRCFNLDRYLKNINYIYKKVGID